MISFKQSRRPQVEALEARWVPATIKLVAGNLFISNQVGDLTVAPQATAGQVKVTDGAQSLTVSGVGSLISITGTNVANKVTCDLAGNTFGGNLLINTGNGADAVRLFGGAGGVIGGSVIMNLGLGNDDVRVSVDEGFNTAGSIKIGGGVTINAGAGTDFVGLAGAVIGGSLTVIGGNDQFSNHSIANPFSVGGNLTYSNPTENLPTFGGLATQIRLGVLVAGNASFTTAGGNDLLRLNEDSSVAGNLTANLGGGNDTYQQGSGIGPAGTFTVNGSVSVNAGEGNNKFFVGTSSSAGGVGGATIGGNLTLTAGSGTNTYELAADAVIFGNLSVQAGNGVNDLATTAIKAQVAGGVSFNLGNGNNLITFDATSSVGGRLNVQTGNGNNTLTLQGAQTYLANIRFCSGNDTLVLNNAALVLTGYVDADGGTNTFTQTLGTLSPNFTLIGF